MATADPDLTDPRAYRRLAALIRQQIGDGTLQSGRSTPSITSLSQQHGHARQTCSKALRILEGEGLLARVPELGYYVCWRAGCDARCVQGASRGQQPCTSRVPLVHLSCTSDVPASVAAVVDGERGRWRRRAGLLYQSQIGCFLGRRDQGRGSSSAMFSRYLMAFTCASGVSRRRARSARRRISAPGFSGSWPRCPDQMAILVKSSEYSSLRAHRALASGCRICPRSICEMCGLGIPVRRSTSRRLHPR